MIFKKIMITYKPDQKRMKNFTDIQQKIPDLEMFDAFDSINSFQVCKLEAKKKHLCTEEYISHCNTGIKGNLGRCVSHLLILKQFVLDKNYEWLLILEDDIGLRAFKEKIITELIEKCILYEAKFVQLYTNPKFIQSQIMSNRLETNLYQMVPQIGTSSYLISKEGAKIVLSKIPSNENIDQLYCKLIKELNALCFINNIFLNYGALTPDDKFSKFGSVILDIKPK